MKPSPCRSSRQPNPSTVQHPSYDSVSRTRTTYIGYLDRCDERRCLDGVATAPCSAPQAPTRYAGDWPSTSPPAEGVDDDRQKQEFGIGRHVGYIRNPRKVGRIGLDPALHDVRSWAKPVVAVRGAGSLAPGYPGQAHLSHQPRHALATDLNTVGGKLGVNTRRSVSAAAVMMDVADAGFEDSIVLLTRRQLTVYDAAYLEVAFRGGLPLATLDHQLREAAQETGVAVVQHHA